MSYVVGIDLGTTSTVAAVCRPGGAAQVVPLEGAAGAVPSAVYLGADGTFLVGEAAQRRALSDPGHVVRDLTRRVGDATPVLVGRRPVSPDELAARFLAKLVDDVARREGGVAARVAVTHPASFGPHRMGALHAALAEQGLGSAMLVAEPVAAAAGYAAGARVEPGATVGVYDLGGGRCDATVLRRERDGFTIVGAPEGVENFGGSDLDEVVLAHVREALGPAWEELDPADPDVLAAVADLRRAVVAAKEALSHDTEVLVPVALPGVRTQVRLGRAEFEEMIRPALAETAEAMRRALDGAGTSPADLAALVLVGGSSRIPLVPQLLSEEFGRDVTVAPDPLGVVAVGAALVAAGQGRSSAAEARPSGRGGPAVRGGRVLVGRPGSGARCRSPRPRWVRRSGPMPRPRPAPPPGVLREGAGGPAGRVRRTGNPAARRRRSPRFAGRHRGARGGAAAEAGAPVPGGHTPDDVAPAPDRAVRLGGCADAGGAGRGGGVRDRAHRGRHRGGRRDPGRLVGHGHLGAAPVGDDGAGGDAGAEGPAASPPPRRGNRAAPTTTNAPPRVTTAPPTAPEVTEEPAETAPPEETAPPQNDGGGGAGGGAGDDQGAGRGRGSRRRQCSPEPATSRAPRGERRGPRGLRRAGRRGHTGRLIAGASGRASHERPVRRKSGSPRGRRFGLAAIVPVAV